MDVKECIGKYITMYLTQAWPVVVAPVMAVPDGSEFDGTQPVDDDGFPAPDLLMVNHRNGRRTTENADDAKPVLVPFIRGKLIDGKDGEYLTVLIETDCGGLVHSRFNWRAIHSWSVVHKLGVQVQPRRVEDPPRLVIP